MVLISFTADGILIRGTHSILPAGKQHFDLMEEPVRVVIRPLDPRLLSKMRAEFIHCRVHAAIREHVKYLDFCFRKISFGSYTKRKGSGKLSRQKQ